MSLLIIYPFLIASLLARFLGNTWYFELNSSASHYYLVGHIVFLVLFCRTFFAKRFLGMLWVLLLFLHALRITPYIINFSETYSNDTPIKFLELNVNTRRGDAELVSKAINDIKPDIIGLLEVDQNWIAKLSLEKDFPYSKAVTRDDNFGVAIYSKYPYEGEVITSIGEDLPPVIRANIRKENFTFEVVVLHAVPPISEGGYQISWLLLRRLSAIIREKDGPLVVLGDLNSSPWGNLFGMFKFVGKLKSISESKGVFFTWNAYNPLLKFPIDHIFYKGGFEVRDAGMGAFTGSDHYPLFVELARSSRLISSQMESSSVRE